MSGRSASHRLAQVIGVGKQARPLEVIPRQQDQNLAGVGGAAEEPSSLGAVGAARGTLLVECFLPGGEVPYLVTDQGRFAVPLR
jgi:hypothetical protein